MNALSANTSMRAGKPEDRVDGWVIQTKTCREWLAGCPQAFAFGIAKRRIGVIWVRGYTQEADGRRVILA